MQAGSQHLTNLVRVGRKLAVLGVRLDCERPEQMRWWHVANPGSWSSLPSLGDGFLRVGRSLCGLRIATNGYAQDHRPPKGAMCPACEERI